MISLKDARKKAIEVCGGEFPYDYTELSLQIWSDKGIISREIVENDKAGYPDIILAEIITAIRLIRKNYQLNEIAQARCFLDLKDNINHRISNQFIVKIMNQKKIFIDEKFVAKHIIEKTTDCVKMLKLIKQQYSEYKIFKIRSDYLEEFLKAMRETKQNIS